MRSPSAVLYLAILLCGFATGSAQPPELSSVRSERLLGTVRAVEEFVVKYSMAEGKTLPGVIRPWRTLRFDRAGNAVEALHYDNKGELRQKLDHTFDAAGRPNGYRSHSATPMSNGLGYVQEYVWKRDAAGRVSEYAVFEAGGKPQVRFTYTYDGKGPLIEETWYTHLGALGGKTVHTFEPDKRKRTRTHYGADGTQVWMLIEEVDALGRVIRREHHRGTTLKFEITFAFDPKGRLLEQVTKELNPNPNLHVSHEPEPGRLVYSYDEKERTKELRRYDLDGQLLGIEVWKLDEKGNETEWAQYYVNGVEEPFVTSFYDDISKPESPFRGTLSGRKVTEYQYDRHGNWILKRFGIRPPESLAATVYREEIRKISYF